MKKILIADDDPAILDALTLMLEEDGYEVESTTDGTKAQTMNAPLPDLLLLDIWMSGIDGRDICRFLKTCPTTKEVPIILVSATKDIEQITKDCQADDFIAKPFQMEHLLTTVAKYVNQ